jgi:hypothetical protein
VKIDTLLNRAERLFLDKEYKSALDIYAIALSLDGNNIEAKAGAILCDLGFSFKEEAQVLYYYFQTIKDNTADPISSIENLSNTLVTGEIESDIYALLDADMALYDGIDYEDFLNIIKDKENFKEAFEDAIFSTRVIISKKWEFIDFIKKLTENGYYSVALDYLETHAPMYQNDQEILRLYSLLPKGSM